MIDDYYPPTWPDRRDPAFLASDLCRLQAEIAGAMDYMRTSGLSWSGLRGNLRNDRADYRRTVNRYTSSQDY
jgi:hypothetical protein